MAPRLALSTRCWRFLGPKLQEIRKAKGMRAEDVALRMVQEPECAGVSVGRVRKLEGGFARPTLAEALALEAIFRVPVRRWYEIVMEPADDQGPNG